MMTAIESWNKRSVAGQFDRLQHLRKYPVPVTVVYPKMEPRESLDVENINHVLQCLTDDVKTEGDEPSNCDLSQQGQDKDKQRLEHEIANNIELESPYVRTMDIEKLKHVFLRLIDDFKSEDNEIWSSVMQPQVKDKNGLELEHELHFDPDRTFISI